MNTALPPDEETPLLWYFAYGSNLDPDTFVGRRGMRPCDTCVALLPEYRLVFDLPVGKGERGVANLIPDARASVTGVAYQISTEQAQRLDRSEGVPRAYQRIDVSLEVARGPALLAFSYLSPYRHPDRKPSPRYMGLLLRGAKHHDLPRAYVESLRNVELAVDERDQQIELFPRPRSSG